MQKDHRNGHRSLTLRKWGRDDLEQFFEQEHLSKTGVEKPPKSSRPAFSKVLAGGALCRQGYRQARNKAYSKQHTETLPLLAVGLVSCLSVAPVCRGPGGAVLWKTRGGMI